MTWWLSNMIPEFFVGCKVVLPADLICEDEDMIGTIEAIRGAELVVTYPSPTKYQGKDRVFVFAHEVKQVVL